MTSVAPPFELVQQPRVQDINAGRPYRIAGIPVPTYEGVNITAVTYWLEINSDDKYGATTVFSMGPNGLPTFDLTGQQTSQLGTLLASVAPTSLDSSNGTTAVGWYRMFYQGTDTVTTETVTGLSGHGPVLVRLATELMRKGRILLGYGSCGCAGGAAPCGCNGGAGGCSTCDHPLPGDGDNCNVLTQRARVKGRWRGPYSDLTPPDNLGPYQRYDVVSYRDSNYVYVGPADGVSPCDPPGHWQ
jgi:hypothetical protein